MGWLRRLLRAEKGSIALLGAMSLTAVIGMSGIAVELGSGYAAKVRNQRVADMAALGGAVAYNAAGQSLAVAQATATDIVRANGFTASNATIAVTQVTVGSQSALKVSVQTNVPIRIASILTSNSSYSVQNEAYASLTGNATSACITALGSSGNSVSATGGASISASGCAVNANGTAYSDNSSAKITAKQVNANAISDTAAAYSQNAITTNPTPNNIVVRANAASDTIGAVAGVKDALCSVNKLTGNSDSDYPGGNTNCTSPVVAPVVPANTSTTDWTTNYQPKTGNGFNSYSNGGCSYTVPAGTYNIRTLTISGGCSITFANGSTLTFNQIDMNGANMSIGDGDLTVSGTFTVNGNNTVTVGNGTHIFGTLTINGGKSLTLGTGNLTVGTAISLSGGAFLKANISTGNTVTIGNNGSGTSISVGGGSQLCFTSDCLTPTAAAGTFSANGTVNNSGGGSTIVFPKAVTHVINGDLSLSAAAIFGPGLYIVKGNFTNGTGCGGCVMQGSAVTFALGGTFSFGGGTSFDLSAPTSTSGAYGVTDILFATKSTAGTSISAGSTGKAGGVIYAPKSAFTSSGGSSISSNGSACMMLVVNSVAVSGSGTVYTANCSSQASASSGTVALLQ